MLLEIRGEITPERPNRQIQNKNNNHFGCGDGSKVLCYKDRHCIWTWNVRSVNRGKLEVVKQEMARVNINILGISKLKWIGMGEFKPDDHYIYYCGQESLRRNGVALRVNKRVWNPVLGCNLRNNRMNSVWFQGKPFNIIVIQVYAPTRNTEEVGWFCEDLQDLLELTPKKEVLFHYIWPECKSRKSRNTWSSRQIWLWSTKRSRSKANRFLQENALVIASTLFQQHKRRLYTWTSPDGQY